MWGNGIGEGKSIPTNYKTFRHTLLLFISIPDEDTVRSMPSFKWYQTENWQTSEFAWAHAVKVELFQMTMSIERDKFVSLSIN